MAPRAASSGSGCSSSCLGPACLPWAWRRGSSSRRFNVEEHAAPREHVQSVCLSPSPYGLCDLASGDCARRLVLLLLPSDMIRLGRTSSATHSALREAVTFAATAALATSTSRRGGRARAGCNHQVGGGGSGIERASYVLRAASLHDAAEQADAESAYLLLRAGTPIEAQDSYEVRPLHYAAEHDQRGQCARVLLAARADVAARYRGTNVRENWRPLHFAAYGDNARVAALLLEAGAEVNSLARDRTPLFFAEARGASKAAAVLRAHGGVAELNVRYDDAWAGAADRVG